MTLRYFELAKPCYTPLTWYLWIDLLPTRMHNNNIIPALILYIFLIIILKYFGHAKPCQTTPTWYSWMLLLRILFTNKKSKSYINFVLSWILQSDWSKWLWVMNQEQEFYPTQDLQWKSGTTRIFISDYFSENQMKIKKKKYKISALRFEIFGRMLVISL